MNSSKTVLVLNTILGKLLSIVGYSVGAFFLLGFIITISSDTPQDIIFVFVMCSIFIALCVFMIIKGRAIKRRIKRFKSYVALISYESMTSLQNLASSTNQTVDFVIKDLQKMIDMKFFKNACVDMKSGEIIIGKIPAFQSETPNARTINNDNFETETVHCYGCGAVNTKPKGQTSTCEYCGLAL